MTFRRTEMTAEKMLHQKECNFISLLFLLLFGEMKKRKGQSG
jgi:hypothetical protein